MQNTDTGKVKLAIVDNRYLHVEIYTDEEIIETDIKPVTDFFDQFSEPVPALIERTGHYAISVIVQIAMLKQTKQRLKAVAYLERDHKDAILTRIAAHTYFRDVEVKSFFDRDEALAWLVQFFPESPLMAEPDGDTRTLG